MIIGILSNLKNILIKKYNNRKRNFKVGLVKHFALNYLLEQEKDIKTTTDYYNIVKFVPKS